MAERNDKEWLQARSYSLTNPDSWTGQETSLLAERDSKVLVSAQAAFLPVPKQGQAQFNPVLFHMGPAALLQSERPASQLYRRTIERFPDPGSILKDHSPKLITWRLEEPADWWQSFWQRFESNTGMSRKQARDLLESLGMCARSCSEFEK